MTLIQSAVPLRVGAAIDDATGEVVDCGRMIGWLLDLVAALSADLMGRCWRPATFTKLREGVDALGRKLPPTAAVVAQRLGWIPQPPAGVYVSSRVVRLAQANVVPILKTLAYRDRLIPHVMAALSSALRTSRNESPPSHISRSARPGTESPPSHLSAAISGPGPRRLGRRPATRRILHAKRPCGTEISRLHQRKAPLHNQPPTQATHQRQQLSETDRR